MAAGLDVVDGPTRLVGLDRFGLCRPLMVSPDHRIDQAERRRSIAKSINAQSNPPSGTIRLVACC